MHRRAGLTQLLLDELEPYPGRMAGALRDTLGVALAVILAETLRVPGISLAVALLFLMQRERPGLTLRTALEILSGAVAACAASLFWVQLTDGTAEARLLGIVAGIFVGAFCMAGSRWPLFWTIFAFYGFVDLAAWDTHRGTGAIVTSALNNLASLAIVVVCAAGVEYAFASSHPRNDLEHELGKRMLTLSRFFQALAERDQAAARRERQQLIQYAHAGDMRLMELYNRMHDSSTELPAGLHFRIGILSRVLEQSILIGAEDRDAEACLAEAYRALARCSAGEAWTAGLEQGPAPLRAVAKALEQYRLGWSGQPNAPQGTAAGRQPTQPFFHPEAFRTSATLFYALKLTLAAAVCYILYNAVAWPGILTCVVTVLFTGLSSTGAMKQKQLFRFAGAAVGGALGVAAVSLLFPNMDSITALVLVISLIALLSGWIMRSPHMGYVGVQIAFAFSLTALPGFSAATALAPARDRLIGISLGIAVMWFIFDQLWPVSTQDELRQILNLIQSSTGALLHDANPARVDTHSRLRVQVSALLLQQQKLESSLHFDLGPGHARRIVQGRRLMRQIDQAAVVFYRSLAHASQAVGRMPHRAERTHPSDGVQSRTSAERVT